MSVNQGNLSIYIDLYRSTPGRRIFALLETEPIAEEGGDDEIVAAIEQAIAINRNSRNVEGEWRRSRNIDELSRRRAAEIDNVIDRTLGALYRKLQMTRRTFSGERLGELARRIIEELLPEGAGPITSMNFEDELASVRFIVERLENDWTQEIDQLGVRHEVEKLSAEADRFEQALGQSGNRTTSWDEVRELDRKGQEAMMRVVAKILGKYADPGDVERRSRLLAPIMEQNERIGELHKRDRRVTDVDPETGEEEPPEGDGESERQGDSAADGGEPSDDGSDSSGGDSSDGGDDASGGDEPADD